MSKKHLSTTPLQERWAKSKVKVTLCLVLLLASCYTYAGDLDRAFKYLTSGDYDKAKENIKEELDKDPKDVAANYAMAKLFSSKDYKGINLDSATIYINRSYAAIPLKADDKTTKKYLKYGVRDFTIKQLYDDINKQAYDKAKAKNTFESYDHFLRYSKDASFNALVTDQRDDIRYDELALKEDLDGLKEFLDNYPKSKKFNDANKLYEQLLYAQMTKANTYEAFKAYLDKYPTSPYAKDAQTQYDRKIYEAYIKKNSLTDYAEFEKNYPKNPFLAAVQDSIYALSTRGHQASDYNAFIKANPSNKNIMDAWNQLYDIYTQNATDSDYEFFQKIYPNSPLKNKLQQDLYLSKLPLVVFKADAGKSGYLNTKTMELSIETQYAEAYPFSGGLAAVAIKPCSDSCIYSYIDKNGKVVIDRSFTSAGDFIHGKAVVAIAYCDGNPCKFGIINRKGDYLVNPDYQDIQPESEGLYAAHDYRGYGFINDAGKTIIPFVYQDAISFSEGVAAVKKGLGWIFIDKNGTQLFPQSYVNVTGFSSGLAAVSDNDSTYGYIDKSGTWAIQPIYENAEPFIGDTAIVSLKETNKKSKDYGLSFRYKIDKTGKSAYKMLNPNAIATKTQNRKRKK